MKVPYYTLDGHTPVGTCDILEWGKWWERMGTTGRRVAFDKLDNGIEVSTVFLGLDHQWGSGPPLLFESMVFGGALDQECDRYSTWEEAEAGHLAMCERVRGTLGKVDDETP